MPNEATIRAYGGQAVLDGVMMRGASAWAVAVRRPDGTIALARHELKSSSDRWRRVPLVRGTFSLVDSLRLGMRALRWSVLQSMPEGEALPSHALSGVLSVVAVVLAIGLFGVGPALVARSVPALSNGATLSLGEGALRITLFIGYIALLGRAPDVRRLFQCHGAEHKAVTALEAGADLSPASVQRFSTRHPRCGTTFLLVVLLVSIVVHALIGHPGWAVLVASRIALLPVVAGLAYEVIRAAASHMDRPWVARAMAPGLALQALTTREPSPEQVEVALAALNAVLEADAAAVPVRPAA